MVNLSNRKFDIVMYVNDEVVIEVVKGKNEVEGICDIREVGPYWAEGLSLRVEGDKFEFYKKD